MPTKFRGVCLNCGKSYEGFGKKFCSVICRGEHDRRVNGNLEEPKTWITKSTPAIVSKRFNIVSLTDAHIPYHSEEAMKCAFEFCKNTKPDIIVFHEFNDMYTLSRFSKDPERANGSTLQAELNLVKEYLGTLREMCPESKILHLDSNHLRRLQKYLWSQAKELCGLDCLSIDSLLGLDEFNIEYMTNFIYKDIMIFKHGDIIRKYSSYTAKNELEREGMSGVSGHSHRIGQHYSTKRGGSYTWLESGCLCDLNPDYTEGCTNDWQHGIAIASFKGDTDHFFATTIPIIDGEILISF